MTAPQVAPYGSWRSPISSDLIASGTIWLGQIWLDGDDVYWAEVRPGEGGRYVVARRDPHGRTEDVTPLGFNARTRVHEYGGGGYAVADGVVFFSNYPDQRLYRQDPGREPRPITPAVAGAALRYADIVLDRRRQRLICVREDHTADRREPINALVAIDTEGARDQRVILQGEDFYSNPRLSPDGSRLAWLSWDHPNLPWDGTELWVGELAGGGAVSGARLVAGGPEESIFQPEWSPDGVLHFVSDRTGWWNLYRWQQDRIEPLRSLDAEFGQPQWVFGLSTYGFESAERILCIVVENGIGRLARLDTRRGDLASVATPYSELAYLQVSGDRAAFWAGSPTEPAAVVQLGFASGRLEVLRRSSAVDIDPGYLSIARPIEFPTEGGLTAHAFFYPPANRDYRAPEGERPPLLVKSHGGPTSAAVPTLHLEIQYWTSRGFAVLDVNYGGSTGYGRAYRRRLEGRWGVVDVDDCANAARHLADRGEIDRQRIAIDGGSAGGYTTLCALTFRDTFKAGASYFGIGDLQSFVHDTHKFESRYLERLVGPYPERIDLYRERSPLNFTDRLSCPVILFQGLEDKIVPPNQAEMFVAALRAKGLPVAYLPFAGEQHGFRRAENIKRALEAEFYFFSRFFGFEPADPLEPVPIENL